jgi:glycogen debranching enzyme
MPITPIEARLNLQLDADFADVFEVKDRRLPPRLDVVRQADGEHLTLKYERAGFRRALEVQIVTSDTGRQPSFVGSEITFDLVLEPKGEWTCCIHAEVVLDGVTQPFVGDPHDPEPAAMPDNDVTVSCDPILQLPFERGHSDLYALAVPHDGASFISAGVPWFMCLFGRDTLVSALMAGIIGAWPARGALGALAPLQAAERDDWRDAEPGKIAARASPRRVGLPARHSPHAVLRHPRCPGALLPHPVECMAMDGRRRPARRILRTRTAGAAVVRRTW